MNRFSFEICTVQKRCVSGPQSSGISDPHHCEQRSSDYWKSAPISARPLEHSGDQWLSCSVKSFFFYSFQLTIFCSLISTPYLSQIIFLILFVCFLFLLCSLSFYFTVVHSVVRNLFCLFFLLLVLRTCNLELSRLICGASISHNAAHGTPRWLQEKKVSVGPIAGPKFKWPNWPKILKMWYICV